MVERGNGGAIVMVSSVSGLRGVLDHSVYCSSKGALDQLTRCLALELGPHKVSSDAKNPVFASSDRIRLKPACTVTEAG